MMIVVGGQMIVRVELFGTLVGVSVFSVMWSEFLMTSALVVLYGRTVVKLCMFSVFALWVSLVSWIVMTSACVL